ncbi:MAG: hypothetical protein ABI846_09635 [Rudaea sp.]
MSDKKPPTHPPSGKDGFEQEFEKFLREEERAAGAVYRKLPPVEPDAALDARVRALAQRARDVSALGANPGATPAPTASARARGARRWIPAFASAAVLVLAAGIVWRVAPHGWIDRERAAVSAPLDAVASKKSDGAPSAPAAVSTASPEPAKRAMDPARIADDARSVQAAPGIAPGGAPPSAFPAPARPAPAGADRVASNAERLDRARSKARDENTNEMSKTRTPADPETARAKSAPSERDRGGAMPPAQAVAQTASSVAFPQASAPVPALVPPAMAAAPPPPANAVAATADAPERARKQKSESARGALDVAGNARALATPAPPPAPPAPSEVASASAGRVVESRPTTANAPAATSGVREAEERQQQAFADHSAIPPEAPKLNPSGRPTPAQIAAWPPPNCHASGSSVPDVRSWHYPPEVPETPELRFAIVKKYLDLESPEGAAKAYADFRHCYPDDRWPLSVTRRLGTR